MLGERIRKLRKQKKITLEALAGEELTKGMLSLIENNKAKPSIESLTYIAERLGVEVSELLEEISTQELRDILEKAEKLHNTKDVEDKYKQLIDLIEPIVPKLSQGYESARLLDIYSRGLYEEKKPGWPEFANRSAKMYDDMNLTSKRAKICLFRYKVKFLEHNYNQALNLFLKERSEIEANHVNIDPMTRVDFDYNEAIGYFAVGNMEAATQVMENAIKFSKEHRIFYRINDLYRLATAQAMMVHNEERKRHYLMKLKQYGDFADDVMSFLFCDLLDVMSLISEKQDYVKALEQIEQYFSDPKMVDMFESLFLLEKSKALYGLRRFVESIDCLNKVKISVHTHHPFDLALFYVKDSYKALCYHELGNLVQAVESAKIAVENFAALPESPFKEFAFGTLTNIESAQ